MGKLTVKQIEQLPPGKHDDGDGLRLVVKQGKSGVSRSWVFRYQANGKRPEMGLGSYPVVGLREARVEAAEQRRLLMQGIDPVSHRNATRATTKAERKREQAKAVTFESVAADYIESHRAGWRNEKHGHQWERTLSSYAFPVIGKQAPADVTTEDVLQVLKPIWLEKPETASRVRNRIELVLDAAKARGLAEGENPARWRGHLDKLLPKHSKVRAVKHHPALPYAEVPAFMAEVAKEVGPSFRAVEMTILTACRTSEVLKATWDEIDLERRIWTIPGERMKAEKEHRVPLTEPLVELLESLPRIEGNPHLFPGMKPGQPLSNMSMLMALRRMKREGITMHGFRSSFRDWAGECTPHPRDVCEQALAHSLGNSVEAAYRRGDLFEKRRVLMTDWASYCTTRIADNVVQMRRAEG